MTAEVLPSARSRLTAVRSTPNVSFSLTGRAMRHILRALFLALLTAAPLLAQAPKVGAVERLVQAIPQDFVADGHD